MRTVGEMDRELKQLRSRLKRLEGGDEQSAVSELVGGTHDAPATKKGLSGHVADAEKGNVAKQEGKARDWCLTHPEDIARQGAPGELAEMFALSLSSAQKLIKEYRRSGKRNDSTNTSASTAGRFVRQQGYF
jgi:hypothetical protein